MIIKYFEYLCCKIFTRLLLIKTIVLVFPGWTKFQIIIILGVLDAIQHLYHRPLAVFRLACCNYMLRSHTCHTEPYIAMSSRIVQTHIENFRITLKPVFRQNLWKCNFPTGCSGKNCVFSLRQHWATIGCTENGHLIGSDCGHSHCVENLKYIYICSYMQARDGLQWIVKKHNFS